MMVTLQECSNPNTVANDLCVVTRPITVEEADVFTDKTARQILTFDETYDKLCK